MTNQKRTHKAQDLVLVIHGTPYDRDGEILRDVIGLRHAAAVAKASLCPGQYVLAYVKHTGGRTPADPVAKWVCTQEYGFGRVNV